jgi:hypothetical protein
MGDRFIDCEFKNCSPCISFYVNFVTNISIRKCVFDNCSTILSIEHGTNVGNLYMTDCIVSGSVSKIFQANGWIISAKVNNVRRELIGGFSQDAITTSGGDRYEFKNIDGLTDVVYPAVAATSEIVSEND